MNFAVEKTIVTKVLKHWKKDFTNLVSTPSSTVKKNFENLEYS